LTGQQRSYGDQPVAILVSTPNGRRL